MPLVNIRGVRIYFSLRRRVSPPVLFIHGAGGNHLNWFYQIEQLPYTTIAIDLPGHGNSEGNPLGDITEYASFVQEFLDKFTDEFILVGHSMGGHIALRTLDYGSKVRGVALISSTAKLPHLSPPESPENFCTNMFYSRKYVERCIKTADRILMRKTVFEIDLKASQNSDVSDIFREIGLPVLFIFGIKDKLLKREEIERTVSLPQVSKAHFLNAGHMVMIEKYERVNFILTEWINTIT